MTKSKKTLVTSFSLAIASLMLVGLTLAYLTDQRMVNNFLQFGSSGGENGNGTAAVQVSLTEQAFVQNATKVSFLNGSTQEVKEATLEGIKPGDSIKKDPAVKNIGSDDIFVRVKFDITPAQLTKLKSAGLKINPKFVFNEEDKYYYYTEDAGATSSLLAKGSSAVDFFVVDDERVSMKIPTSWTSADIAEMGLTNGVLHMPIVVEAIQADNFNGQIPWKNDDNTAVVATAIVDDSQR